MRRFLILLQRKCFTCNGFLLHMQKAIVLSCFTLASSFISENQAPQVSSLQQKYWKEQTLLILFSVIVLSKMVGQGSRLYLTLLVWGEWSWSTLTTTLLPSVSKKDVLCALHSFIARKKLGYVNSSDLRNFHVLMFSCTPVESKLSFHDKSSVTPGKVAIYFIS